MTVVSASGNVHKNNVKKKSSKLLSLPVSQFSIHDMVNILSLMFLSSVTQSLNYRSNYAGFITKNACISNTLRYIIQV